MKAAGLAFRVFTPDVEEVPRPGETPAAFAARAARDKAEAVARRLGRPRAGLRLIVGCDTIVVQGGRILGKPRDARDASRMLRSLSGARHEVISGLCVIRQPAAGPVAVRTRAVRTIVEFRPLGAEEIQAYIESGEPFDKAGAYGIQGGAAGMVRAIRGSYTNVVGLPLAELMEESDAMRRACRR
jgi:septum formation protein